MSSWFNVLFRIPNKAANAFIEPRREDGHGSASNNRSFVADDYAQDILTVDQPGDDDVLEFDLGVPAKLVAVDVDVISAEDTATYICRVSLDGSDPNASRGWRCRSGQTTYIPMPCSGMVKVYAPSGVTVSVQAGAR